MIKPLFQTTMGYLVSVFPKSPKASVEMADPEESSGHWPRSAQQ